MIIGIAGNMGSGKTLLMTILTLVIKHVAGVPVYSNYELEKEKKIESINQLRQIKHGVIALDEFWITMESRSWDDKNIIRLTRWINQTRKKDLIVIYTTQSLSQIDVRVRNGTDIIIEAEKRRTQEGLCFYYHLINGPKKEYLYTIKIPEERLKAFYKTYNSTEIINVLKYNNEE